MVKSNKKLYKFNFAIFNVKKEIGFTIFGLFITLKS